MTFVNIAVAISALAGGAFQDVAPNPNPGRVFVIFRRFLDVFRTHGNGMLGHFGKMLTELWVILAGFRHWKNDQK